MCSCLHQRNNCVQIQQQQLAIPGVPFVEGLNIHILGVGHRSDGGSHFAAADEHQVVAQLPLSVAVAHARHLTLLVRVHERVLLIKLEALLAGLEDLLAEVLVHEGGLQGQVARAVGARALLLQYTKKRV